MVRIRSAVVSVAVGAALVVGSSAVVAQSASSQASSEAPVRVNDFMSYDAAARTVMIQLVASSGSANGGMNFNGGYKGDQTITVPAGWMVKMSFVNKDAIPHSAILLPDHFPLPMQPDEPAFARAYTNDLTAGLPTGGRDSMNFTATPAGTYLIVCGVPGHGPSGMYITFVVSSTAKVPSYKM